MPFQSKAPQSLPQQSRQTSTTNFKTPAAVVVAANTERPESPVGNDFFNFGDGDGDGFSSPPENDDTSGSNMNFLRLNFGDEDGDDNNDDTGGFNFMFNLN